jgi:hypothetical protein
VAHLDTEPFGGKLYRRLALGLPASGEAGRLGVRSRDLVPRLVQREQRRHRKLGRAHEDDPHCHSS